MSTLTTKLYGEKRNSVAEDASTSQEAKLRLPKLKNNKMDRNANYTAFQESHIADIRRDWIPNNVSKRNSENNKDNSKNCPNSEQFPKLHSDNIETNNHNSIYKQLSSSERNTTKHKNLLSSEITVNNPGKDRNDSQLQHSARSGCTDQDHDQPLLNRWGSEADSEEIWQQERTFSEIKHLATTLGINNHIDRQLNCKASNIRWNPVKESVTHEWWKQSKKWTKHSEEMKSKHKIRPGNEGQATKRSVKEWRRDPVVNVPGIGCSYRLPVVSKGTVK